MAPLPSHCLISSFHQDLESGTESLPSLLPPSFPPSSFPSLPPSLLPSFPPSFLLPFLPSLLPFWCWELMPGPELSQRCTPTPSPEAIAVPHPWVRGWSYWYRVRSQGMGSVLLPRPQQCHAACLRQQRIRHHSSQTVQPTLAAALRPFPRFGVLSLPSPQPPPQGLCY